jgi:hypothetical protein
MIIPREVKMIFVVLTIGVSFAHSFFLDDDEYYQDPSEDRTGTIPKLNITTYLNTAMEPHNALVQVTQNWLNFCMGTIFWFTSAAIYYRVNPPRVGSVTSGLNGRRFDDSQDSGLYKIFQWANDLQDNEHDGSFKESPVKSFLSTFSTVLTGVANTIETASR